MAIIITAEVGCDQNIVPMSWDCDMGGQKQNHSWKIGHGQKLISIRNGHTVKSLFPQNGQQQIHGGHQLVAYVGMCLY